jgi:hypothetical protein
VNTQNQNTPGDFWATLLPGEDSPAKTSMITHFFKPAPEITRIHQSIYLSKERY